MTPNPDGPRNGGEQRNMKIGDFHLCPKGHGMVRSGKACPQCELEAILTPEQKASMLKAWAQEQIKKSNEKLRELTQVFTEGNAKQPSWAGEIYLPRGEQSAEVPNKSMDEGATGDQETMSTNSSEVERKIEAAWNASVDSGKLASTGLDSDAYVGFRAGYLAAKKKSDTSLAALRLGHARIVDLNSQLAHDKARLDWFEKRHSVPNFTYGFRDDDGSWACEWMTNPSPFPRLMDSRQPTIREAIDTAMATKDA